MKKLIIGVIAVFLGAAVAVAAGFNNVTSREAKVVMEKNPKAYLLDVRTPEEFRQARLKGAVLIPISDLQRRLAEVPKNRPVVVYCAVGSRSLSAAGLLTSRGYKEVYNISDGIIGWYRSGFAIEK